MYIQQLMSKFLALFVSSALFFLCGVVPSYVRRTPIQRTWVLTLTPMYMLFFLIVMDGEYMTHDRGYEITRFIAIMAMVFGVSWYITNLLDKKIGGIHLRKGDSEITIGGESGESDTISTMNTQIRLLERQLAEARRTQAPKQPKLTKEQITDLSKACTEQPSEDRNPDQ